ncbi:FAD:protein FMN transferase [Alteromonadaceae bacterium M269]|nr:FAD:protein FMN transferase [Alteromonadaceae bacterium M269]
MHKTYKYLSAVWVLVLLTTVIAACTPKQESSAVVHLTGATMGTHYNVKYVPSGKITPEKLQLEIDELLVHINKLMSTYDPNSELSQFNQWKSSDPFPLSPETLTVMHEAIRLGVLSDNVLDVTVGPLVNLWGFGPKARPVKIPTDKLIEMTRERIGLDKLLLSDAAASKLNPDLYVDLSTIAKGYGVDEIAVLLEKHQITNYLAEIGGEMRVSGSKEDDQAWRIAIEKPVTTERAVQRILTIGNNAIATSGDYRNFYEENGVRYSHLINPNTGYPIQHSLVAVSVVHPSCMVADGLATAINVMGVEAGMAFAKKHNIAALLISRENGEFKEYTTAEFEPYLPNTEQSY